MKVMAKGKLMEYTGNEKVWLADEIPSRYIMEISCFGLFENK